MFRILASHLGFCHWILDFRIGTDLGFFGFCPDHSFTLASAMGEGLVGEIPTLSLQGFLFSISLIFIPFRKRRYLQ